MRICIFHNLKKGGALEYLVKIVEYLNKNHSIDIYSFQKNKSFHSFKNYYFYKIKKTKNLFQYILLTFFELNQKSKKIAEKINNQKYDFIIVSNDFLIQSPHILKYLKNTKKSKIIFLSHEPKREFYENTTYDHMKFKRILSRIIRSYIKAIDKHNCKKTQIIITNSFYSQNVFQKIYNKKSYVVQPGLERINIKKTSLNNNHRYYSLSDFSKTKGHHISINSINSLPESKLIISGRKNNDFIYISKLIKNNKNIKLKINISSINKIKLLNEKTIFLCNQIKEPFGISSLEISNGNNYIIGLNLGGTAEIIDHGINGFLSQIKNNRKVIKYIDNKKTIKFYKNKRLSWDHTSQKLLSLYHFLKNEPAY